MVAHETLPVFLNAIPCVDTGIRGVCGRAIRGPVLCVIFEFAEQVHVPEHVHGAQFGIVIAGDLRVRRGNEICCFEAGSSYRIESGQPHEGWIKEGTVLIEFFEDADRY